MKELQDLVKKYYEFLDVIISDEELYCNFSNQIEENERMWLFENGELDNYVCKMILKDILYSFIFNIDIIKTELINATQFFYEEYSRKKTLNIYEEIKKVFKDFHIEEIEKIEKIIRGN